MNRSKVLLFKDSISGTEESVKLPDSHSNCNARTKGKKQWRHAAREELPEFLTLNKFRSRMSEAASPNRCCSHAALLPLHLPS